MTHLTNTELFADLMQTNDTLNKLWALYEHCPPNATTYHDQLMSRINQLETHYDHLHNLASNRVTDSIELMRRTS